MSRLTYEIPTLPMGQSVGNIATTERTCRIYINCPEGREEAIVKGLYEKLKSEDMNCSDIGGLSVQMDHAWWRVRPSFTRNALVARISASSRDECINALYHLRCHLLSFGINMSVKPQNMLN
ncbi:hypothetical protein [Curvivirga sp.]|uniref:hypothetical protein n=1 Tax=Curvivirga sp. TaxID=2856848 RepID=UPI003B5A596E